MRRTVRLFHYVVRSTVGVSENATRNFTALKEMVDSTSGFFMGVDTRFYNDKIGAPVVKFFDEFNDTVVVFDSWDDEMFVRSFDRGELESLKIHEENNKDRVEKMLKGLDVLFSEVSLYEFFYPWMKGTKKTCFSMGEPSFRIDLKSLEKVEVKDDWLFYRNKEGLIAYKEDNNVGWKFMWKGDIGWDNLLKGEIEKQKIEFIGLIYGNVDEASTFYD